MIRLAKSWARPLGSLASISCLPVQAQFSGAIEGTVADGSNSAIPGAAATVKNVATGVVRDARTSTEGSYRIASLGPGAYSVAATKQGFALTKATGTNTARLYQVNLRLSF